ncbi:hypothetical protein SKAU_G00397500 [Synaphobranchus kaupii]|uniref:Uncharacterized protein n=1 Tax=Synaphobranchus kaupii TaxID=118154 RepID=A0A9Q1IC21_SYNKA|nr:hypothetical protein SKAU_G00397500 [Synaphobranchus kaupii]
MSTSQTAWVYTSEVSMASFSRMAGLAVGGGDLEPNSAPQPAGDASCFAAAQQDASWPSLISCFHRDLPSTPHPPNFPLARDAEDDESPSVVGKGDKVHLDRLFGLQGNQVSKRSNKDPVLPESPFPLSPGWAAISSSSPHRKTQTEH